MKKIDRRVLRTKRLLREAMLECYKDKNYSSITIQDITEKAGLNRATFYLHYEGKEELMLDSLEAKFDELVVKIDQALDGKNIMFTTISEEILFEHVRDNHALYKLLLSRSGPGFVMLRMLDYIACFGQERIEAIVPKDMELPVPLDVISHHVAGGLFSLLRWWVMEDMPKPIKEMAEISSRISTYGTLSLFEGMFGEFSQESE